MYVKEKERKILDVSEGFIAEVGIDPAKAACLPFSDNRI